MKHSLLSLCGALLLSTAGIAIAEDAPTHHPKPGHHFNVKEPASVKDALILLAETEKAMQKPVAAKQLGMVHKLSYSLEAVVDKLRKEPNPTQAQTAALDALDEQTQTIHYASEHNKAALVQETFPLLQKAGNEVNAAF